MSEPTSPAQNYAPGWYPDVNAPGTVRYYDGNRWTEHTQAAAVPAAPGAAATMVLAAAPGAGGELPPSGWWARRKWWHWLLIVIGGLVVLGMIINGINGGRDDDEPAPAANEGRDSSVVEDEDAPAAVEVTVPETTGLTAKEAEALIANEGLEVEFSAEEGVVLDRDNWVVLSTTPAAGDTATEGDTVVVNVEKPLTEEEKAAAAAEAAIAGATLGKQNAVEDAQDYLEFSSFSKAGLLQQLTSEYGSGYEREEAAWAIRYLEKYKLVSWKAEAVEAAEDYLAFSSFSRDGLYQQLTSEYGSGFTSDQAEYALQKVGY